MARELLNKARYKAKHSKVWFAELPIEIQDKLVEVFIPSKHLNPLTTIIDGKRYTYQSHDLDDRDWIEVVVES